MTVNPSENCEPNAPVQPAVLRSVATDCSAGLEVLDCCNAKDLPSEQSTSGQIRKSFRLIKSLQLQVWELKRRIALLVANQGRTTCFRHPKDPEYLRYLAENDPEYLKEHLAECEASLENEE
jgi:hypothetical protein